MKPFFYLFLSSFILLSCQKKDDSFARNAENLQNLLNAWEAQDIDASMAFLADDFVEIGTGFGLDRNKEEYKANDQHDGHDEVNVEKCSIPSRR